MSTRIKDVGLYRAVSPITRPIADSTHTISSIAFNVVEIRLENGVLGQGYLLSFHYAPHGIAGALRDVRDFILAGDYHAHDMTRLQADYAAEAEYFGTEGLQKWALAVIDVAMWDAWGRCLDLPVWKILGTGARRVPVYGSGGWLSYSDRELIDEVVGYKERGFRAVKIKVGSRDGVGRDLERLRLCREALGDGVAVMMDANQGMELSAAVDLAEKARAIGIAWFEEPVHNRNYDGYRLLRNKTGISLAMGEREYSCEALKALIAKNALDLWQPDLIRIGGVGAWRDSAALAAAYHIPTLPHYYRDYDVPLLCTVDHPFGAESFDWIDGIIDNVMPMRDGYALPRDGAGWGFRFREDALESL